MRLSKVASEFNISLQRITDFLEESGHPIDGVATPNTRINDVQHNLLIDEFKSDVSQKKELEKVQEEKRKKDEELSISLEETIKPNIEEVKVDNLTVDDKSSLSNKEEKNESKRKSKMV